jgi:hypothetical protein
VAEPHDRTPDDDGGLSPAERHRYRREVMVDPKDIPPESMARIRAHAQRLAVQLGLDRPAER